LKARKKSEKGRRAEIFSGNSGGCGQKNGHFSKTALKGS
jgi:hypothetical protein